MTGQSVANARNRAELVSAGALDAPRRAALAALVAQASAPNPYFSPFMLEPALAAFGDEADAHLLFVWRGEALIGFLPLFRERLFAPTPLKAWSRWGYPGAGFPHCYDSTPLAAVGEEEAVFAAIFDWLDGPDAGAGVLKLSVPGEGAMRAGFDAALAAGGARIVEHAASFERAALKTELDADAYFANAISGKHRKELRRQARRLEDEGAVRFEESPSDPAMLAPWIAEFLRLEAAGWKGRDGSPISGDPAVRQFFEDMVKAGAETGAASMLRLVSGETSVAMLVLIRAGDAAATYKIAFDEAYARFSPGVLLMMEATRRMLADPEITWADSCADPDHPMIDRLWTERVRHETAYIGRKSLPSLYFYLARLAQTRLQPMFAGRRSK